MKLSSRVAHFTYLLCRIRYTTFVLCTLATLLSIPNEVQAGPRSDDQYDLCMTSCGSSQYGHRGLYRVISARSMQKGELVALGSFSWSSSRGVITAKDIHTSMQQQWMTTSP